MCHGQSQVVILLRFKFMHGTVNLLLTPIYLQGSHSDWKTSKNGKAFSSQGKVREFRTDWKSQGKSHKILEISEKCYVIF